MQNSPDQAETNLAKLLEAFAHLPLLNTKIDQATQIADTTLLSHSLASKPFLSVCNSGQLLSQRRLVELGRKAHANTHETQLGTDQTVFFFASTFCYPNTTCGLLFKTSLEHKAAAGDATPFDSGGLFGHLQRTDGPHEPAETFAAYRLPLVRHRLILRESLLRLFSDPDDYIRGKAPVAVGPIPLSGGDRRRWTHEIRIVADVDIWEHLEAAFVDRRMFAKNEIVQFMVKCQKRNIPVIFVEPDKGAEFKNLPLACLNYLNHRTKHA